MVSSWFKIPAAIFAIVFLASTGLAYNQMTVYAYDENGRTVDDVTITVEGVNNDYYEQKSVSGNSASFYDYTAGQEYHFTVEENNGDLTGEKTTEVSSRSGIFVTMNGDGGDPGDPNQDPSVSLETPSSGATNVELRPGFSWSGSDSDGDSLSYNFYLEKKSYDGDRPWSDTPEGTTGTTLTPDSDLDENTEYIWGVEVSDGNGGEDRAYRTFTTGEQEQNTDPSVSLQHPNSNEQDVELRPEFRWSGSDSDGDSLSYEFYLEEKSYDGDRPWSANPRSTSGTSLTPNSDLNENTEYVWGVKVSDGNGGFNRAYRYFTTGQDQDQNTDPSVQLQYPNSNENNVNLQPTFRWSGSDSDGDSLSYQLFVEERTYDDDRPWSANPRSTSRTSYTLDYRFDRNTEYVWGVKAEDGNGGVDRSYRYFTTRESQSTCSFSVTDLNIQDPDNTIERGETADVSFTLHNNGDQQDFRVRLKVGGGRVMDKDITLGSGDSRSITRTISPDQDSTVTYIVDTEGSPCGSRTRTDSAEIYVNPSSGGGPAADFSYSPSNPDSGETVGFTSTSTDPDNDITSYRWTLGDGTTKYGSSISHSYSSKGTYTVGLKVTDSEGNTDFRYRDLTVGDGAGDGSGPDASFNYDPKSPKAEQTVTFTSTSTDPDGDITSYTWNFGDGSTSSGSTVTHTFQQSGSYPVQMTVKDSEGNSDSRTRTVNVGTQYTECSYTVSDLRLSDEIITEGESADISYTVSNDGDRQNFRVRFQLDGKLISDRSVVISSGNQRTFSHTVSPTQDSTLRAIVTTSGTPCGYNQEVRYDELYVNPGDGTGDEDAELRVVTRDEDNQRTNAFVRVQNGETMSGSTGSNGERTFDLEPGTYEVRVTKDGYRTQRRDVHLQTGEITAETFDLVPLDDGGNGGDNGDGSDQDIQITELDYPGSVCRGDSFVVYATVANNGDRDIFTMTGTGPGSGTTNTFALSEGNSITRPVRFTNVQGSGAEDFTIRVQNGNTDTRTASVNVQSCFDGQPSIGGSASSISMDLNPSRTVAGDSVKVRGYVDGISGRTEVTIKSDGDRKARVSTQPDGYYQTYIREEQVGSHSISATAGGKTVYRDLEVVPTASANFIGAPREVFQGEQFRLCAGVNSQIEPDVLLLEDGQIIQSKSGSGTVCFNVTSQKAGEHDYTVRALTYGQGDADTTTINVLETGVEASSFPEQIASVESGSGIVKVDLYNTHDGVKRYNLRLENIEETWVAQSEKEIVLTRGERKTVYFYFTPQDEGVFRPDVVVEADGSEIYRQRVTVTTGGTHRGRTGRKGFIGSVGQIFSTFFY